MTGCDEADAGAASATQLSLSQSYMMTYDNVLHHTTCVRRKKKDLNCLDQQQQQQQVSNCGPPLFIS